MNIWAWISLIGIFVFTLLPILSKTQRTKTEIRKAMITTGIVLGIIILVSFFQVNYLFALILGLIAYILFDKKTYTKKRLIIYGTILLSMIIAVFILFRDNPDYVLQHLKNNPETTSLYMTRNGEEFITYQSETIRPLASTVKIVIAIEYAIQVAEGMLDENQLVALEELSKFHYPKSDGNAHEEWVKSVQASDDVTDGKVTLHEVAKGMITYSSNANTDFLIHLLGLDSINERIESLGLTQHEPVYPLVSPLLISKYVSEDSLKKGEIIEKLEAMPMDRYREMAIDLSNRLQNGEIAISATFNLPMDLQKIWSDRLTGASAHDYGKLLSIITNDELPGEASEVIRDLMEWPLEYNEANKDFYLHLGAKGGSTAFILNDALYVEDLSGNKMEIVIFTDQLNIWQNLMLQNNLNSFQVNLISDEDYRIKVKQELEGNID